MGSCPPDHPFVISLQISFLTLSKNLLVLANHEPFQILSHGFQEVFFAKLSLCHYIFVEKTTDVQNKLAWAGLGEG